MELDKMKPLRLELFAIAFVSTLAFSQNYKHILKVHPLGIVNKLKLQYEYMVQERVSVGGSAAIYYRWFKGPQIGPQVKIYFSDRAPASGYIHLQAQYFNMTCKHTFNIKYRNGYTDNVKQSDHASGVGFGFGIGKQWAIGNSDNFLLNIMIGAKYYRVPPNAFYFRTIDANGKEHEANYHLLRYFTGPGSLLNNQITLGMVF